MRDQHWEPVDANASGAARAVERVLQSARELLGMEIAWIAEFRDGMQVFRNLDGDASSFGVEVGQSRPLHATYCHRVARGAAPQLIPDTAREPSVRDLEVTASAGIRSYVGVPIELDDGTCFGTMCCASHRPNQALSERDLAYLRGLSRQVAQELEDERMNPLSR